MKFNSFRSYPIENDFCLQSQIYFKPLVLLSSEKREESFDYIFRIERPLKIRYISNYRPKREIFHQIEITAFILQVICEIS